MTSVTFQKRSVQAIDDQGFVRAMARMRVSDER